MLRALALVSFDDLRLVSLSEAWNETENPNAFLAYPAYRVF